VEARPEYVAGDERPRPVGYVIEISATHDDPHVAPVAGCPACAAPLATLEEIVAYRRRGNRPEVRATILVEHGEGFDRPIDACEQRCLDEIVSRLKQLGACEGQWRPQGWPRS
jgi:hypothetical protein